MTTTLLWKNGTPNLGRAVACIGKFDGVHLGHQRLISETVRRARAARALSVVLTFDRNPACVIAPDAVPPRVLPLEANLELIAGLRPDFVVVLPFTGELAALSAERFLDEVLSGIIEPVEIVVGKGFRLGAGATSGARTMRRHLAPSGCRVVEMPLVEVENAPAASSRVREFIESGELAAAEHLLGRPHTVVGDVLGLETIPRDGGRSRHLVRLPAGVACPSRGVFSCVMRSDGAECAAIATPVASAHSSRWVLVERAPSQRGPLSGHVEIEWGGRLGTPAQA
jgi:riboflavin kinase/FMN adenylyltransferase